MASLAQGGELFPGPVYPTGGEPWDSVMADFNADGHMDAAITGYDGRDLRILLGRGDGSFTIGRVPAVQPLGLAVGDFNADGRPDLVASGHDGDSVRVFLGVGDGTFAAGEPVWVGSVDGATFVAAGDLNEDGYDDLVASFWNGGGFATVLGNGDGTFAPPAIAPMGFGVGTQIVDVDGDSHLDVVIASSGLNFRFGAGDGTFPRADRVSIAGAPVLFAVADLNGDGRVDFATANRSSHDVAVLLNLGGGEFASDQRYPVSLEPGGRPWAVAVADVDADGTLDLLVGSSQNYHVSLFPGYGDGSFEDEIVVPAPLTGGAILAGHFDNDNRPDVLVASGQFDATFLLRGRGDGSFSFRGRDDYSVGGRLAAMARGDFNGDGFVDLAVANGDSDNVTVLPGDGQGGLLNGLSVPVGPGPTAIAAGPLNLDRHPDLLVLNGGSNDGSVLLNRGDGTFAETRVALVESPHAVALGNFDGDVATDLAVLGKVPADVVTLLSGVGDGTFLPVRAVPVGIDPVFVTIADLDRNGAQDLIVANRGSEDLSLVFGNGDGSFDAGMRIPLGDAPRSVTVADLDDDPAPDLIVALDVYPNRIVVMRGAGSGAFSPPEEIAVDAWPSTVAAGDLDGDGTTDLAVSNRYFAAVTVLTGSGDGSFREPEYYSTGGYGVNAVIDDFDGDGRKDIAVANLFDSVTLLISRAGPASLAFVSGRELQWPGSAIALGYAVYRGAIADLIDDNGDGAADGGYGACASGLDQDLTDRRFFDAEVPPPDSGLYYLVGALFADGHESLGSSTSGVPRAPTVPCGAW